MRGGKASRLGLIAISALVLIPFLPAISWSVDIGIAGAAKEVGKELRQKALEMPVEEGMPIISVLISTVAGTTVYGYNGDGILATSASLDNPTGVFVDTGGNIYIADKLNGRIRKVSAGTGFISTVAGTGAWGYNGDERMATSADLADPIDVFVDAGGNIYIADSDNHRIRKVDAVTGLISTVAGTTVYGYNGDGILATSAYLYNPSGVCVDNDGNIYIADRSNYRIRKVDAVTGLISTVAGTTVYGYNGDGILATSASLDNPTGVFVDTERNIYIADLLNGRIRKVSAGTGFISTVAGTGEYGYNGDERMATSADLAEPIDVFVDTGRNIYIADTYNRRIRRVDAVTGLISTVAGTGAWGYNGDGILATSAYLYNPSGVCVDNGGNIYIADTGNHRIRKVGP